MSVQCSAELFCDFSRHETDKRYNSQNVDQRIGILTKNIREKLQTCRWNFNVECHSSRDIGIFGFDGHFRLSVVVATSRPVAMRMKFSDGLQIFTDQPLAATVTKIWNF